MRQRKWVTRTRACARARGWSALGARSRPPRVRAELYGSILGDKCEISPLFHCSSRSASLFETSLRSVRIAIITRDQCIPRSHSRDQCIHLLYPEISPFETSEVQISAFVDGHREISVLCTELCKFSAFPSRSLSNLYSTEARRLSVSEHVQSQLTLHGV